jgi:hypothetical protein
MVHVAGPEIFHDAVPAVRDCGHFDDRHVHLRLCVAKNLAERIL